MLLQPTRVWELRVPMRDRLRMMPWPDGCDLMLLSHAHRLLLLVCDAARLGGKHCSWVVRACVIDPAECSKLPRCYARHLCTRDLSRRERSCMPGES